MNCLKREYKTWVEITHVPKTWVKKRINYPRLINVGNFGA